MSGSPQIMMRVLIPLSFVLCRLQNADSHSKPSFYKPLSWVVVRLIAPIIVFGPVCGVISACILFSNDPLNPPASGIHFREAAAWVSSPRLLEQNHNLHACMFCM